MILSEEDLFDRLASPSNISVIGLRSGVGRSKGDTNLGDETKVLLGLLGNNSEESKSSVAAEFGVSTSRVSTLSRGLKSDNESLDSDLKARLDSINAKPSLSSKTEDAHSKALDVLVGTLEALRPKLGEVTKATDLSKIAANMSRVASSISQASSNMKDSQGNIINKVQVIVQAPQMRAEADFEVIEVK